MKRNPKEKPRAILFDLDDTIIAFDSVSLPVWQEVCASFSPQVGVQYPVLLKAVLDSGRWYWSDRERHRIGRNNQTQARRDIVCRAFDLCGIDSLDHAANMADIYSLKRLEAMYLFPGSIETLKYFCSHNVKLVLVTNGEATLQREKINRFRLEPYFEAILIEGELGYGKPQEKFYSVALERVGALASQSWIVGDNLEWEVEVPSKMGFYTIWNDVRGKGIPKTSHARPHRIVTSIKELME